MFSVIKNLVLNHTELEYHRYWLCDFYLDKIRFAWSEDENTLLLTISCVMQA